jgi:hypothetical protein
LYCIFCVKFNRLRVKKTFDSITTKTTSPNQVQRRSLNSQNDTSHFIPQTRDFANPSYTWIVVCVYVSYYQSIPNGNNTVAVIVATTNIFQLMEKSAAPNIAQARAMQHGTGTALKVYLSIQTSAGS